jgi:hypothetical protein
VNSPSFWVQGVNLPSQKILTSWATNGSWETSVLLSLTIMSRKALKQDHMATSGQLQRYWAAMSAKDTVRTPVAETLSSASQHSGMTRAVRKA